jgi:hypothetical protein
MANITAYTDIITLSRARKYLRVDDTMSEDDDEIVSMIKASFLFIERYTNHLFGARDLSQYVPPKIYNYPINSIEGVEQQDDDLSNYYQRNMDKLCYENRIVPVLTTYNAGYENVEDVPEDFIQAALQILKVWYFEAERQVNETLIPVSVRQVLDTYRRFV